MKKLDYFTDKINIIRDDYYTKYHILETTLLENIYLTYIFEDNSILKELVDTIYHYQIIMIFWYHLEYLNMLLIFHQYYKNNLTKVFHVPYFDPIINYMYFRFL